MNSSAQARLLKAIDVFNEQAETQQLNLVPSQVARVLVNQVRLERTRQLRCWRSSGCARPAASWPFEQRSRPSTALDDLLGIEEGKRNETRLYHLLGRILPQKTKLERHLKLRYGKLFGAEFDVPLFEPTACRWWLRSSSTGRASGERSARRIWVFNRGIVSEENPQAIRRRGGPSFSVTNDGISGILGSTSFTGPLR